jgi:hypothetical protein
LTKWANIPYILIKHGAYLEHLPMKIGKFEPMAIFVGIVKSVKRRRRQRLMKKYKWFIAGIAALWDKKKNHYRRKGRGFYGRG